MPSSWPPVAAEVRLSLLVGVWTEELARTSLITYLPATVNSVTISQTGGELMLNLAGMGSVALSKVQTIGI